jgi:hypothetical protein
MLGHIQKTLHDFIPSITRLNITKNCKHNHLEQLKCSYQGDFIKVTYICLDCGHTEVEYLKGSW